ncbi:hydrolase [Trinickia terrae]|uniref:Hydrolase n=1 Tax=Trinickia terrae TaxID=2571161 RepID=A0A4U1I5N2_9BURK|nr:dienelactone hydrolase family protein [Trinickia terrae]TKC88646.1 hydrolase [Trinickia terrae]
MNWTRFEHGRRCAPLEGPAQSLVALLHGVGGSSLDLLALAESWREALPDTAFVSFDGSEAFDGGGAGRQWFSRRDIDDLRRPLRVANAYPALHRMLSDELALYGLDFDALAIVGFSQGSIMALHHAAVNPAGAAVVVAYSGRLGSPIAERNRTPLTLIHGADDETIPVLELERAAHAFSDAGYAVEAYALPAVGHAISSEGALLGRDALVRALVERPRVLAHLRARKSPGAHKIL